MERTRCVQRSTPDDDQKLQAEYGTGTQAYDTAALAIPPGNCSSTNWTSDQDPHNELMQCKKYNDAHLATILSPAGRVYAPRWIVVFTAVNKQSPQRTCPHGVIVAKVGGEKHTGHVYEAKGSTSWI